MLSVLPSGVVCSLLLLKSKFWHHFDFQVESMQKLCDRSTHVPLAAVRLSAVWSKSSPVLCVHPSAGVVVITAEPRRAREIPPGPPASLPSLLPLSSSGTSQEAHSHSAHDVSCPVLNSRKKKEPQSRSVALWAAAVTQLYALHYPGKPAMPTGASASSKRQG